MRIQGQNTIDSAVSITAGSSPKVDEVEKQGSTQDTSIVEEGQFAETFEVTDKKLQQAVSAMNKLLEESHHTSKFVYHEGLDRYYVEVVDAETEKVVKEIPPEKLLDAFYKMQKQAGMIVDEKI